MTSVSLWQDTSLWPDLPHRREQADVCIVGAGIVGSTLAHFLTRAGKSVVVLEARDVALGASGRNAGHVSVHHKSDYHTGIETFGHAAVREARDAGFRNREIVRGFLDEYGVWYEAPGSMTLAYSATEARDLEQSAIALMRDGYDVEWHPRDPTGRGFFGALTQPGDLATQSYWLTTKVMEGSGATVIPNCPVREIEPDEAGVIVRGARATVRAAQVCLCTNAWSRTLHPFFLDKVHPIRGQMLATAPMPRFMERTMGCDYGYLYFRQMPDGRFVIGGWRNHFVDEEVGYNDSETTPHLQAGMESFIRDHFPEVSGVPITHRWSGIMGFTNDGIPLVGQLPDMPNVYFAVGFTGGGMGIGPAAAERTADLMLHGTHPGVFAADRATALVR